MLRKTLATLAAVAAAGFMASAAKATVNLQLTIVASPVGTVTPATGPSFQGGTWQVYATLTGNTSTTLGLAGIGVDLSTTGNVSIYDYDDGDGSLGTDLATDGTTDLPANNEGALSGVGFSFQDSTGNNGVGIVSLQNTTAYKKGTGANASNTTILQGVGLAAGSADGGVNTWANPVLVADGYYEGTSGSITANSNALADDLLPATLPAPTTSGVGFSTNFVDTVNGGPQSGTGSSLPAPIGTPEPASLGVLALGGVALMARKRRKA